MALFLLIIEINATYIYSHYETNNIKEIKSPFDFFKFEVTLKPQVE